VSGLARGIDTCAHLGALEANGRTITVLGCGMNVFYPPENKKLREDISNHGCVISEFPLDSLPNKFNFPRRNRIISGLSLGVVVIEADINSGALITANLALEQGREVFALPGQVGSKTTRGVHYLIKQGAKLVESAEDILEEIDNIINFYRREGWTKREPKEEKEEVEEYKAKHEEESSFSNKERLILSMLTNQPEHIDNISYKTKINSTELSTILLQLELKGKIEQLFGKRFRRLN
jgi:DNA processing protein